MQLHALSGTTTPLSYGRWGESKRGLRTMKCAFLSLFFLILLLLLRHSAREEGCNQMKETAAHLQLRNLGEYDATACFGGIRYSR